jgi:hypothetical protein
MSDKPLLKMVREKVAYILVVIILDVINVMNTGMSLWV